MNLKYINRAKTFQLLYIIFSILAIIYSCNNNPVNHGNTTSNGTLIYSLDSISRFTQLNNSDTVFTDTTIKNLKFSYDLFTNDLQPDSSVSSGFFISGIPSVAYSTFGKFNNGHVNYQWQADTGINYLHIGFEINYKDSLPYNIKMYNIQIFRIK
jgi:hypothetical protein